MFFARSMFSNENQKRPLFSAMAEEVKGSEKQDALRRLTEKYAPEYMDVCEKCIARRGSATTVVRITVRRMMGKGNT